MFFFHLRYNISWMLSVTLPLLYIFFTFNFLHFHIFFSQLSYINPLQVPGQQLFSCLLTQSINGGTFCVQALGTTKYHTRYLWSVKQVYNSKITIATYHCVHFYYWTNSSVNLVSSDPNIGYSRGFVEYWRSMKVFFFLLCF